MASPTNLRVCADVADLASNVAGAAATILTDTVRANGRCSLVLPGGSTPRPLYERWASAFRDRVPWQSVDIFWGDERFVPPDDPRSNYKLARETLLDHVPCPAANIHRIPTTLSTPEAAAADYEVTLRQYFAANGRRFDLVLLGLGPEGHTASLFPASPALEETARLVVAATVPAEPPSRVTLTLPALNSAAHVFIVLAGAEKAAVLERVLENPADVRRYPAAGIRPLGDLVWWVDREAAARYQTGTRP